MTTLEITQADIDKAYEVTDGLDDLEVDWCNNCPAAQALKRLYPNAVISVGFSSFGVNNISFYSDESAEWISQATDARTDKNLRPTIKPITFQVSPYFYA